MSPYGGPSKAEVYEVAKQAAAIFKRKDLDCCLTGGAACALRGNPRSPNDVDLVVMTTTMAQSALKQMLCDADASFYTVAAKTPGATYRVLYYRLTGYRRCCKVDILTPGTMNIPAVPARRIRNIKELPVMPFSGVLFLKLQAWEDHNHDPRAFMRSKQYTDASDIQTLLKIAVRKGLKPAADKWAPDWFIDMAKRRAKRFMAAYGGEKEWKAIGVVG